jgi:HEXXH motif-containing protein
MITEVAHGQMIRHVLPDEDFAELSTGLGGPEVIRRLWETERSRRLLVLKAFHDEAVRDPSLLGPLPSAEDAWGVLRVAEEADRTVVDSILMHPQVGTWAAYALRRRRGGAQNPEPLWVDFGQIHALSLVAAARASLAWRTRVPLRCGRVMLPTLGLATFSDAGPSGIAEAQTEGGRITLRHRGTTITVPAGPGVDTADWWPLHRLRAGTTPALTMYLDDLDPFRDFSDPVPPARLDDAQWRHWQSLVEETWELLCRDHRDVAEAMAEGVVSLVPLPSGDVGGTRSASTGEAFGMIISSEPPDSVYMAEMLVHEFSHIKLGGLTHLVSLTHDDPAARYYAPWRYDPRPVGGFLQGIYAFTAIAAFWRDHWRSLPREEARLAAFEYAFARGRCSEALQLIQSSDGLTELGRRFALGLQGRLDSWRSDPLPSEADAAAELVRTCERSAWRFRNLQHERDDVVALAAARIAGDPSGKVVRRPVICGRPPELWSTGRTDLARMRMKEPDGWRDQALAVIGTGWAADLTRGDVLLTAREFTRARSAFAGCIVADPDDINAWSGLAAAQIESGSNLAAWTGYPELIRAVHAECAVLGMNDDPVELATWIDADPSRINDLRAAP